jgi:MFS family permease
MAAAHDPYAALRHPNYCFLLAAGVLASIGQAVQTVAVGWELWARTHDAALLGYSGLAQFVPVLLLALPAGHAADRFSRKLLLQSAQALLALSAAGLALLSVFEGPIPLVFLCLAGIGCARAFAMPARGSLLAHVVPPEVLPNAVTWNSTGFQIANVGGPALGGMVVALAGGRAFQAYVLAASCFVAAAVLLLPLRPRPVNRPAGERSLASLLAGVRFVWRTELMLAAIALDLFAVLLGGATALLPIYAKDILRIDALGLGGLRAAPALGALAMAILLAHRPPLRRPGLALLVAVSGFGIATIVFGISRDPVLSFVMLALTGAFDNVSVVVRGTLMQMLTPDPMRGRVAAVNALFISSSNELGEFESGITADWFGPVVSVVGGGIGTLVVVAGAAARWPQLLRLGPLHHLVPEGTQPSAHATTPEKSEKGS